MLDEVIGGALIGLGAVWLWYSLGRIAGISGIAARAMTQARRNPWPLLFLLGLGAGGWLGRALLGPGPDVHVSGTATVFLVLGGLLVGFGTRLGSGCTSGHGVCGSARLSRRSITATVVFLTVGMLTATAVQP